MSQSGSQSTNLRCHTADDIYFAFADGMFDYDCVSCGSECCKGHGYALALGDTLEKHLSLTKELRLFVYPCKDSRDHVHVKNFAPGCFFLRDDGKCGVQMTHGYDSKPGTCRLFPFNNVGRVGRFLVVGPHHGLCPLRVMPPGAKSERSSYESLSAELNKNDVSTDIVELRSAVANLEDLIAFERRIVHLSETHRSGISYGDFAARQLDEGAAIWPSVGPGTEVVRSFGEALSGLLDTTAPLEHDEDLATMLIAITPCIRSRILFRRDGAEQRMPLPSYIPQVMLGLYAVALLAKRAGMAQISYQTLSRMYTEFEGLLLTIAYADTIVVWRSDGNIDLAGGGDSGLQASVVAVSKALLPSSQRRHGTKLATILNDHARGSGLEKSISMRRLASRLYGRIEPFSSTSVSGRRVRFWPAMQRLALAQLPVSALVSVAGPRKPRH